jgi:hypothetical protein
MKVTDHRLHGETRPIHADRPTPHLQVIRRRAGEWRRHYALHAWVEFFECKIKACRWSDLETPSHCTEPRHGILVFQRRADLLEILHEAGKVHDSPGRMLGDAAWSESTQSARRLTEHAPIISRRYPDVGADVGTALVTPGTRTLHIGRLQEESRREVGGGDRSRTGDGGLQTFALAKGMCGARAPLVAASWRAPHWFVWQPPSVLS